MTLILNIWPPSPTGLFISSCTKFYKKNIPNFVIPYCVHKVISRFVYGDLDLWPSKSIGFILLSWLTCLPSLKKMRTTVESFFALTRSKRNTRMYRRTYGRTDVTTAALLYCIQLWIHLVLFSRCGDLRLIRPVLNSPTVQFSYIILYIYNWISPVLNSPSGQRAKRLKIKRGRNFPCIQ